jgi:two-component system chemotaxis response regulator CheB
MKAIRVLVVDDSAFFRKRLAEIFKADPQLEVIGAASNGQEGLQKALELKPDVITMDIEMPVMDGITAVKQIMQKLPTPILMFSSLTHEGAKATLDALDAGAADFMPKSFEDIAKDFNEATTLLRARVKSLGQRAQRAVLSKPAAVVKPVVTSVTTVAPARSVPVARTSGSIPVKGKPQLIAIGSSTGGPVALQQVLKALPKDFPLPIVLIQHMPATFTGAFAQRLDQLCAITVKEAQDRDVLAPGLALLAPGGKQMIIEPASGSFAVRILESTPEQHYRPCVDVTLTSVAKTFPGRALALVLTGMGSDGREGAKLMKQGGSPIWAQDEKSCVVYGMPAAIVEANLADAVLTLSDIGSHLATEVTAWTS